MKRASYLAPCIVAAVMAMIVQGCTGGCSRTDSGQNAGTPTDAPAYSDNPADILASPVDFDAQRITEYAATVAGDTVLSSAEAARLIVNTEAAVNHLGQIIDELERNDDPADTWNVLTELTTTDWTTSLAVIIDYLGRAPLDAVERERAVDIDRAVDRIIDTADRASANVRRAPSLNSVFKKS